MKIIQGKHPLGDTAHETQLDRTKPTTDASDTWHTSLPKTGSMEQIIQEEASQAKEELLRGLHAIRSYPKTVTFYGSARLGPGTPYYEKARRLAARCCDIGVAVATGGGPGIMEAGNRGTYESCGYGVGFNIELPSEQVLNKYATHGVNFKYFFTRKTAMGFSAEVYLCFPGGFGTFDETFELLTLIQTGKSPKIPVILVGSDFWKPVDDIVRYIMLEKFGTISPDDTNLYQVLDDEDEIMRLIKDAPLRDSYPDFAKAAKIDGDAK